MRPAGTRISLESVVYSFKDGQSPEAIQEDFPLLKRSQIYGAIAFYPDHEAEIDRQCHSFSVIRHMQVSRL